MATPRQLLQTAKASLSKPAVRKPTMPPTRGTPKPGGGSSTVYQEGSPAPRVTAKPDPNAGIGGNQSSGAGGAGAAGASIRSFPGFKPAGTVSSSDRGFRPPSVSERAPTPSDGGQMAGNTLSGSSGPIRSAVSSPTVQPQKPAWQQLAERGIGGQGSAAANQAKLRELQAGASAGGAGAAGMPRVQTGGGAGVMSSPVPPPERIAAPTGPMPAGPAVQPQADQMPVNTDAALLGFKPRPGGGPVGSPGGGGFIQPRPMDAGLPARGGLGGAPDPVGTTAGGMGVGSDGDFSAFGGGTGGGGFGDLARVGAGVAARRRFPVAF